jgi:hypothetical protein
MLLDRRIDTEGEYTRLSGRGMPHTRHLDDFDTGGAIACCTGSFIIGKAPLDLCDDA